MGFEPERPADIELEFFHKHLSMLINTGLPMSEGIRFFAGDIRHSEIRTSLEHLAQRLEKGESLSQAMSREKQFFPPGYTALIHAGEQSGTLFSALAPAAEQARFQSNFRSSVKSSLLYPALVFILICAAYSVIICFSYPVFFEMYQIDGQKVPWLTNIIYKIFTEKYSIVLAALFGVMIFVFRRPGMQPMTHSLLLRIPLLKNVLTERFIVFFSEGMAILLGSGIPVSESLDILAGTAESNFGSVLKKAGAYAREGTDFETILSSMKVFPNLYIDTCSGEKPDFLPDSLLALANIYKSEAEYNTRKFLYTLNAVMILMIGIWTGCLLTAMYLMSWRFHLLIFEPLNQW